MPMQSITTNSPSFSSPGTKSTSKGYFLFGIPTANVPSPLPAPTKASARAWWTATATWRRICQMTASQIVMFTHQNASVWADLALILWAAGLRVTAAWTIATETDSGLKEGNYVQGTVLLVLRKQTSRRDGLPRRHSIPKSRHEVKAQLDAMLAAGGSGRPQLQRHRLPARRLCGGTACLDAV